MRVIQTGDKGAAVVDVQQRLKRMGFELAVDGEFGPRTLAAVREFSGKEVVDAEVWNRIVDASFALGDRTVYLKVPHFHGRDVHELQTILATLGFAPDAQDGIFGPHTEEALIQFQASAGLPQDGIAGADTFAAIKMLRHTWEGKPVLAPDAAREHQTFARAVGALERMDICLYGLDDEGRRVAARAANLARATTENARLTCAQNLRCAPENTTLMLGLQTTGASVGSRAKKPSNPVVQLSFDEGDVQRLHTAMHSTKSMRIVAVLPCDEGVPAQHLAVELLDILCQLYT